MSKVIVTSARNKEIRHMNADPRYLLHKISMGISITIISLDIEQVNADPSPTRHPTSQEMHLDEVILMIGTTTQGILVITIRNMDMFLRIS